jgi:hypothetical protein
MNSTTRNPRFVPKGCHRAPQESVTLGAGVQWSQAYGFAATQNVTLVGGDTPQIGASGGWVLVRGQPAIVRAFQLSRTPRLILQGGGHSFLSPSFGLGVDNLLEMDIVTPDGKLRTISECSNPELFWAVRHEHSLQLRFSMHAFDAICLTCAIGSRRWWSDIRNRCLCDVQSSSRDADRRCSLYSNWKSDSRAKRHTSDCHRPRCGRTFLGQSRRRRTFLNGFWFPRCIRGFRLPWRERDIYCER